MFPFPLGSSILTVNIAIRLRASPGFSRLATHLKNLEKSGNLIVVREKSGNLGKVGEIVVCLWCATTVAIKVFHCSWQTISNFNLFEFIYFISNF